MRELVDKIIIEIMRQLDGQVTDGRTINFDPLRFEEILNTRTTRPDAEKVVDELLDGLVGDALVAHGHDDGCLLESINLTKSKLLALLAPVVPDEKNLIGAIWNQADNTFTCQHCGAKHDLGKYKVVKSEPVTPEAGCEHAVITCDLLPYRKRGNKICNGSKCPLAMGNTEVEP